MDHYLNWEYNSRDKSEDARKWSRGEGRAKMRTLYQGGHGQVLQIAWSTVRSPWEDNCISDLCPGGKKEEEFIHGLCFPWPEIILTALTSSPNSHSSRPCTGAMAVSRRDSGWKVRGLLCGMQWPVWCWSQPVPVWCWSDPTQRRVGQDRWGQEDLKWGKRGT